MYGLSFDIVCVLYPMVYITSDMIQEIYGYEASRLAGKLTAIAQLIFAVLCFITIEFFDIIWLDENSNQIIKVNVLANIASGITIASIISYYVGDWVNDIVFNKLHNEKNDFKSYGKRAFISSFAEKFVDTPVFYIILALLPGSEFTFKMVVIPVVIQISVEFCLLPLNYKIVMFAKNKINEINKKSIAIN
jgi:uncharacterized PurR-regulated membrane protein YhhQ (DUF165 family)